MKISIAEILEDIELQYTIDEYLKQRMFWYIYFK